MYICVIDNNKNNNDMENKFFHYRNAFKSDHLASADIEELQENNNGKAILTLKEVNYFEGRSIAGRKVDKSLIAFFIEKDTKPLVVNATNAKVLSKILGTSNVNEWVNLNQPIELTVVDTTMKGQRTTGIRIKLETPKPVKHKISGERFNKLIEALESGSYSQDKAKATYQFTNEQLNKIKEVCGG